MNELPPRQLLEDIRTLLHRVARGELTAIVTDPGYVGDLSADQFEGAIEEYPATPVAPPQDGWEGTLPFATRREDGAWVMDVPIWTAEEGMSELEVHLVAHLVGGQWQLRVGSIHVP